MDVSDLSDPDRRLVEEAATIIEHRFDPGSHHVGAAVRASSGRTYSAVHLETAVGRAAVCAEPIAIGQALAEGETPVETIVAVRHPHPDEHDEEEMQIIPPCGICRELIFEYGPDASVVVPDEDGPRRRSIAAMLPEKPY